MERFSRRESQILEILYARGQATVADVHADLEDPPAYDSVRTTLRILVEKKAVKRKLVERKHVYSPVVSEKKAWKTFAARLANSFFGGSMGQAALAILRDSELDIDPEDLKRIEDRISKIGQRRDD